MANFFNDNSDIRFLFGHMDVSRVAAIAEHGFRFAGEYDFAPENAADAVDNYRRILEALGEMAGETIAPTADETDRVGNRLDADGKVTYAPGIENALRRLGEADLMGFTLPYEYGGLNCPQLIYTMSIDIISRADASLMNIYGLQGIAETISAFASDEVKAKYLPDLARGRTTGAMVLTEPDAGSDLQSVQVRAYQDEHGNWRVSGVKRFITNGCGDVLLVLARSEPELSGGRGLSLFLVERGARVKVRRLEEKLGIHGSPTCELVFDDVPAVLIGERRRGLTTYVMSLMNAVRIGVAAQSLGIGEAAYRVALDFASKRKRMGTTIDQIPAVRELLVGMAGDLQAARALTYFASLCVDLEKGAERDCKNAGASPKRHRGTDDHAAEQKKFKKYNSMLVPMCKYAASETAVRIADSAVAVLGGSGYMRDYAVERHLRDSRITTIYEGTSQIQVVAAVRPVLGGAASALAGDLLDREWPAETKPIVEDVKKIVSMLEESVAFVEGCRDARFTDLHARRLVDMACMSIVGALFCGQAAADQNKRTVARRWLETKMVEAEMLRNVVCSGDRAVLDEFEILSGARQITLDVNKE